MAGKVNLVKGVLIRARDLPPTQVSPKTNRATRIQDTAPTAAMDLVPTNCPAMATRKMVHEVSGATVAERCSKEPAGASAPVATEEETEEAVAEVEAIVAAVAEVMAEATVVEAVAGVVAGGTVNGTTTGGTRISSQKPTRTKDPKLSMLTACRFSCPPTSRPLKT